MKEMSALEFIVQNSNNANDVKDTDYQKDGVWFCGKCNTKRQIDICAPNGAKLSPMIMCECMQKEHNDLIQKQKEAETKKRRIKMLGSEKYLTHTFENDDSPESKPSKVARAYADNFKKMYSEGAGITFAGTVGTGKSFYACCIANSLIDCGKRIQVLQVPDLVQFDLGDNIVYAISNYDLVVFDDLGSEYTSSNGDFSSEKIFSAIDMRVRSGKPFIVTTNIGFEANKNGAHYKRIFDRMKENNVTIQMKGESKRTMDEKSAIELLKDAIK